MATRKEQTNKAFDRHHKQKKERLMLQKRCNKDNLKYERKPDFTYADLKAYLDKMTPEQLAQQVQILSPGGSISDSIMLEPAFAIGSVQEMCSDDKGENVQSTHSALDFQHHPEQIILLSDYCPFGEDGDSYYTMDEDENGETVMIGNKSGKAKPIIKRGRCEPTTLESRSPAMDKRQPELTDEDLQAAQAQFCKLSRERKLDLQELNALDFVQSELYRRIYHLSTKEEMAAARPKEEEEIEKWENEEVGDDEQ
jgi:hypothetical protein